MRLLPGPPTGELAADREAVYEALRAGNCYLAPAALAPAAGFHFEARHAADDAGHERISMGSEVPASRWILQGRVPRPARLSLVRDGRPVCERHGQEIELEVDEPGVYRVEAYLKAVGRRERLWVLSNPIYIRSEMSSR
jgi:hypothetical protein